MPQVGGGRDYSRGLNSCSRCKPLCHASWHPGAGAVVSVTEFLTDGQRNVLPGHATLKGDVRARIPSDRTAIEGFMRQIATGIAAAHNVEVDVTFKTEFIETINAEAPTEAVIRRCPRCGIGDNTGS